MTPWPTLSRPIYAADTHVIQRAISILHGVVPDPYLTDPQQARDVIRWHESSNRRQ